MTADTVIKIDLKAIPLDEKSKALLQKGASLFSPELVEFKIIVREWELWEVSSEGRRLGVFITRACVTYDGVKELVIMLTLSEYHLNMKLSNVLLPIYEAAARLRGCQAVRIHTVHKPIEEFLERNGYRFQENIYIKKVS